VHVHLKLGILFVDTKAGSVTGDTVCSLVYVHYLAQNHEISLYEPGETVTNNQFIFFAFACSLIECICFLNRQAPKFPNMDFVLFENYARQYMFTSVFAFFYKIFTSGKELYLC
jgi:hypothetical protein